MTTCLSIKNGANQLLRFLLYVSFLLILQNQFLELSRIRCFKPHQLSRDGMIETEFESMQGQASDRIYVFQSIASVADNGMPQILHVYTYLVFSSRFQVQFNERVSIGSFDGTVMRNGFLSSYATYSTIFHKARDFLKFQALRIISDSHFEH